MVYILFVIFLFIVVMIAIDKSIVKNIFSLIDKKQCKHFWIEEQKIETKKNSNLYIVVIQKCSHCGKIKIVKKKIN